MSTGTPSRCLSGTTVGRGLGCSLWTLLRALSWCPHWGLVPPCSYTEADEHKIQHCFCYTSTVLTSTLAFQKEQKLKCECQVRSTPEAVSCQAHACVPCHGGC